MITKIIHDPRMIAAFCAAAAVFALGFAYTSQYGFGLQPCHLCWLQRYPYMAIIPVALLGMFLAPRHAMLARALIGLCAVGFLTTGSIGVFQVGVEQGWWTGSESCVGVSMANLTPEQLLAHITSAPTVRCDEIQFELFGISMAGYNALFAFGLAAALVLTLILQGQKKNG